MARLHSHAVLLFSCALAGLLSRASADPDSQTGNITLNPASASAVLRLRGQTYNNDLNDASGASDTHGITFTAKDQLIVATAFSVGEFHLQRPHGAWFWSRADDNGGSVTMMDVNNDHSLTLHNPSPAANAAAGEGDIILRPGTGVGAGVYFNNARLATATDTPVATSLCLGGGSLWDQWQPPGLLAVGAGAQAIADQAIALGHQAYAFWDSQAFGDHAVATEHSTALGADSYATNHSFAIGSNSHGMGFYSFAYGCGSYTGGIYSMAFGCGGAGAPGTYNNASINANAWGQDSFAACWGLTDGVASISLGGYSFGYKSFSANSGSAFADYSTAIGLGTRTYRRHEVAVGRYNTTNGDWQNASSQDQQQPGDVLFSVGNGTDTDHRSNAFTVSYEGQAAVAGPLTVAGAADASTPSVFMRDVSVKGVLRVPPAGDLGMGGFSGGPTP